MGSHVDPQLTALAGVIVGSVLTGGFGILNQTRSSRRQRREKQFDELVVAARRLSSNAVIVARILAIQRGQISALPATNEGRAKLVDQQSELTVAFTANYRAFRLNGPETLQSVANAIDVAMDHVTRFDLSEDEFNAAHIEVLEAAERFDDQWIAFRSKWGRKFLPTY